MSFIPLGVLAASGAGGGGSFESIATVTGNGSSSSLSLSSIPSTYKHLQLRVIVKDTSTSSIMGQLRLQFNSDTGSNYTYHRLLADGASVSAGGYTGQTGVVLDGVLLKSYPYPSPGVNSANYGVSIIDIHDYSSTTKNKTVKAFNGADRNGLDSSSPDTALALNSSLWLSTSAISSITIYNGTFTSGSTFALYGIKG